MVTGGCWSTWRRPWLQPQARGCRWKLQRGGGRVMVACKREIPIHLNTHGSRNDHFGGTWRLWRSFARWCTATIGFGDRHGEPHHLQPQAWQGVGTDHAQWSAFHGASSWRAWFEQHRAERHWRAARHPGQRPWRWRDHQVCGHALRGWDLRDQQRWQWLHADHRRQGQDTDAQAAHTSTRIVGWSGEGGLRYVVYFVTGLQTTEKDVAERMQVLPHGDLCWCGDPQLHRCQH